MFALARPLAVNLRPKISHEIDAAGARRLATHGTRVFPQSGANPDSFGHPELAFFHTQLTRTKPISPDYPAGSLIVSCRRGLLAPRIGASRGNR